MNQLSEPNFYYNFFKNCRWIKRISDESKNTHLFVVFTWFSSHHWHFLTRQNVIEFFPWPPVRSVRLELYQILIHRNESTLGRSLWMAPAGFHRRMDSSRSLGRCCCAWFRFVGLLLLVVRERVSSFYELSSYFIAATFLSRMEATLFF